MNGERDCPGRETLAALLLGKLPPEREEAVNRHLETCAVCEAQAQELEQQSDPLIDALRQPAQISATVRIPTRASAPPPANEPLRLDGYQILREVGRGGMGVVYLAQQHRLNRLVAVKMILTGGLAEAEDRVRFMLEGELLARLSHPNFVQVYEVGTVEPSPGVVHPYLVLEHVDGGSLKARMMKGPLAPRDAAHLVLTLARAMETAHAQGIVHRDLKPANVLIARDGTLKITDFGLAKELSGDASLTPTGRAMGTPAYMAPEQAVGNSGSVGPAADVYALGAILYELLTGRPPFAGEGMMEVLFQVVEKAPTPPRTLRPGIPRDLETVCLKCLEKKPQARYARAAALADDLENWLGGRTIRARPAGRWERMRKWVRRHPLPAALMILLLLSLIGGTAASTYFGATAVQRANDAQNAAADAQNHLNREMDARKASDEAREASEIRAAELQFAAGQALADAGEVDRGMFLMLRALQRTPEKEHDLRRGIQLNLEAWRPYLPRLRWYRDAPAGNPSVFLDKEVLCCVGNQLYVYDPETGQPIGAPREFPGKYIAACGSGGRRVCTRSDENGPPVLRVFERSTGRPLGVIPDRLGADVIAHHPSPLYMVDFSPDEEFLMRSVGGPLKYLRQAWDAESGKEVGPPLITTDVALPHLLHGPSRQCWWLFIETGGSIEVVDAQTGQSLGRGPGCLPADAERPPALFPERQVVQSWLDTHNLIFWDLDRGASLRPALREPPSTLQSKVAADGRRLIQLFAADHVRWQDVASRLPCVPTAGVGRGASPAVSVVCAAPNGDSCLLVSPDKSYLKRFDFPRLLPVRAPGGAANEGGLRGGANSRQVFLTATFCPDRQVVLLGDAARHSGQPYARQISTLDNHPVGRPLTDLDSRAIYSPSGRLVALGNWDDTNADKIFFRVYDAKTGEPRSPLWLVTASDGRSYFLHTLAFSPDERRLAVGHRNGAMVCDLDTGGEPQRLDQPGPITRLRFSRDGRRLAVACPARWPGSQPGVQIWDVTTSKPLGERVLMAEAPLFLDADDADGFFTLELDSGRMRRWDFSAPTPVEDLGVLESWPGGFDRAYGLAVDPARRLLAFGSGQGTIYRWDLKTRRRLGPDADFQQPVRYLAWGPTGRWLAAGGDDGTAALFDPLTGKRAGPLLTHALPLLGLTFSPDGGELLTVTHDGRCHRWELGESQPLAPAEWETWLQAATGLRLDGEVLTPLTAAEYRQRLESARNLPTPLLLAADPARWHADEALSAEQAGQYNSARWHLDRWIALEPKAWLPLARRARIDALEGNSEQEAADLKLAAALCPDEGLENWNRHEVVLDKLAKNPSNDDSK
ncbi:MAG TPA: protein kinase [Gemmataceae bacterium]|nr:protein kinase [Gemmataceae bacterium]